MIPLTVPEVRRLVGLLLVATAPLPHRLRWSWWRRKRQAAARRSHYRRRLNPHADNVPL